MGVVSELQETEPSSELQKEDGVFDSVLGVNL